MDITHDLPNFIHTHLRCNQWNSKWYINCVWNPFPLAEIQDVTGASTEKPHFERTPPLFPGFNMSKCQKRVQGPLVTRLLIPGRAIRGGKQFQSLNSNLPVPHNTPKIITHSSVAKEVIMFRRYKNESSSSELSLSKALRDKVRR